VQTEIVKELNIKEIETKEIYIQTDKRKQNKKDINIQTESKDLIK
jgi:hypothetical protein